MNELQPLPINSLSLSADKYIDTVTSCIKSSPPENLRIALVTVCFLSAMGVTALNILSKNKVRITTPDGTIIESQPIQPE